MCATVRPLYGLVVWLIALSAAWGQITVPATVKPHEPIVATLTHALPAGAQLRGSWSVTAAQFLEVDPTRIHVWAPVGVHTVRAAGVWVLTRDVTIGDQVVPVLVDFGQYEYTADVTVAGEVPPVPPPTPAAAWAIIVEETSQRTPAQAALFMQLRKTYPESKLKILDRSNPPEKYREYFAAVGTSVGLPAVVLLGANNQVAAVLPLPATAADFGKLLKP